MSGKRKYIFIYYSFNKKKATDKLSLDVFFLKNKKHHSRDASVLIGLLRKGRDWLLRSLKAAALNAFPFCSPQGPLQKRDSNGVAEAGIHLKINIYLFPQPPY